MPTLGSATLLTPNRATQIAAGTVGTAGATNAALILGLMQTSDFTSNPTLDVGAGAGNQRNIAGTLAITEGVLVGPTGLAPSSGTINADLVLNGKGTGIVRVGSTGPRVATLNDIPTIPVTSVFGQTGGVTAAQGVAAGLAAGIYPSVPLGVNTTLSLAVHHNHLLNATAAITLTVPTPGTLTDGFWTCLFTDSTHAVTISGALYDLTGTLITTIPPATAAHISVWGGLTYALLQGVDVTAGSLSHGTLATAFNFVGYDGTGAAFRLGPDDFASYIATLIELPHTIAYSATPALDCHSGLWRVFEFGTLTGNIAVPNPTNIQPGQTLALEFTQDGTGSRTASWGSAYRHAGGLKTLSTAAGAVDRWVGVQSPTTGLIYGTMSLGYAA